MRVAVFGTLVAVAIAIYFQFYKVDYVFYNKLKSYIFTDSKTYSKDVQLFTIDELSKFNGITRKQLYLSLLGVVYDVTKGEKHYGPGQSYNAFIGRDASKSFITGNFNPEDISDDVSNLNYEELLSLKQWQNFYEKDYTNKGKLIGRYFDDNGNPTQYANHILDLIKNAEKQKNDKNTDEILYPPCNIEWNPDQGTRVWCSNKSGGIERAWAGYPRKYYKLGSQSHRCACIKDFKERDPKMEKYENCEDNSPSCIIAT